MAYGDSAETEQARLRLQEVGIDRLTIDDLTLSQKISLGVRVELKKTKILLEKRFTLTSAQILALNTTPITLIPAFLQSVIIVQGITARLNFNSIAYTGANNLEFRYTNASGVKISSDISNTFINSAVTSYGHVAGTATELVPVFNSPIVVRVPTANPGAGNSTLDLFIKYHIITF